MKKVLFVATVDSHIELFHLPFLKMFKEKGWETSVATESDKPIKYCDKKISMPIKRSPFKLISNFKAIRKLRKIIKEEKYDIIHCHTPMGGVVARMAARSARKNGTRVIYTAHGFHFYKGAPLHFWLMFYPVEWYLAKYTDTLITINNEDYERAKKKFGKRCKDIQYVPGVGVDPKKFEKKMSAKEKLALRESLGLKADDFVLIFPAELSKRKNQTWLINTLKPVFDEKKNMHLLLPGKDSLNGKCQKLAKDLGLENQVHFLGFRNDIPELLQISDVAVSSSRQEGLPVNLLEAAFRGIPIVATDCRGNRDVCEKCGLATVSQGDSDGFRKRILKLNTLQVIIDRAFSLVSVKSCMDKVYFHSPRIASKKEPYPIDFVVLWVDGADPRWLAKKQKYKADIDIADCAARYRDWGTFKYWFRAVEKYAPWVNHVYLVTDDQKPEWLKEDNPKLTIIDHKDILKKENLPVYNTSAIEVNIHRIPNLSEHFVYFNDDVFLVNKVKPSYFFKNGLPVEVADINAATGMEGDQQFAQMMFNDILLINRHFKKKEIVHKHPFKWINVKYGSYNIRTLSQIIYPYFTGYKAHHVSVPFLKETFRKVWDAEEQILSETSSHRFRDNGDVNQYIFIQWQLCENRFVPRSVKTGKHIKFNSKNSIKQVERAVNSKKVKVVCINDILPDDVGVNDFSEIKKSVTSILNKKLPERSSYEK